MNVVSWWYTEILSLDYKFGMSNGVRFDKYGQADYVEFRYHPCEGGYPYVRLVVYIYCDGYVRAEMLVSYYRGDQQILIVATARDIGLASTRFWRILLRVAEMLRLFEG